MVWRGNLQLSSRPQDAMKLLHRFGDRLNVFNDVAQTNSIKAIIIEGVGKGVQIVHHIHSFKGDDVQADTSRQLVLSTPHVEYSWKAQIRRP
jgi:hypothetical protein